MRAEAAAATTAAAAGHGHCAAEVEEADVRERPEIQVLRHAGERGGENGKHGQDLGHVVPRGDRVERTVERRLESEQAGGERAVDGKRGAREGGGSERTAIDARIRLLQALRVAGDGLLDAREVEAERDWPRGLQVGVAGNDDVGVRAGEVEKGP
jgi:hypothetical protein